jgi:formate dehydrogenase iron-sulfur subunit
MTTRVYVPSDSTARSLGADAIALSLKALPLELDIVRNGSRGLHWLEPLLEIETDAGRIGFPNCREQDVPALFAGGAPDSASRGCIGAVEDHPYLKKQQRLTAAHIGIIDPLSLDAYRDQGGFCGLEKARLLTPEKIVEAVTESGLRGRGGAAFPTGIKWNTVLGAPADKKYIVCNADEGDSGTFVDRLIMECDPFTLIEGMVIAGLAVGAELPAPIYAEKKRLCWKAWRAGAGWFASARPCPL